MKVSKLVVHHSASAKSSTHKSDIEKWHKDKGWSAIGYHMVIEANGVKKKGRPTSTMGSHAKGANANSLGVCLCGNFETETPDAKQITALTEVLAEWCKDNSLNETKIYGHCNVGSTTTSCPGKNLKGKLPTIKKNVKKKLAG